MGNRVLSEFLFQPLNILFNSAEFRRALQCNGQSASVNMYASLAAFPAQGAASVIYLAEDTSKIYYWNGTAYVEMSPGSGGGGGSSTTYPIGIAVSDEVSLLTIGLKNTFRIPTDYTVTGIKASLVEAPTGSWYGAGTLGVGYVTSFTWGDDTPFFVFQQGANLNNFSNLIETAKHEIGHPLGLYHQSSYNTSTCTLTNSYHQGFGTGELSWAPVMGWPLNKYANTWSFGPTPNGCTFLQDNLSIITTTNGFGYRTIAPSTFNSSFAEARGLGSGERTVRFGNFMPFSSDSVSFKIVISKLGVTTIKASPSADGGASSFHALMTMKAKLYDINGNFVAESDDNINSISGTIQQAIAPGTYYLRVYRRDLPQSICPSFFNPPGYGQYGWFFVTQD